MKEQVSGTAIEACRNNIPVPLLHHEGKSGDNETWITNRRANHPVHEGAIKQNYNEDNVLAQKAESSQAELDKMNREYIIAMHWAEIWNYNHLGRPLYRRGGVSEHHDRTFRTVMEAEFQRLRSGGVRPDSPTS